MGKIVKQLGTIEKHLHKQEITELAMENAHAVIDNGKYDLLKVYVELKRYETYLKELIQCLKSPALDKATKTGQKTFNYNEAKVSISTRTKWDFSVDYKWIELDNQIKQLTQDKKDREKYLKENNKVRTTIDKETGLILEGFVLPTEIEYGITIKL
ncbi:hypothetical protein [Paenimyroides viscosum]|uniref:Uncharacterized protein n=1 Tax=Paenimyroides viscosum TaxID=2488729 RepID=A0A3P1B0S2_9FLAO|nr:hypothetical protein [Paenimyroides viscosum]RRA94777.1 hypothetical protein EG242_07995 [Paenimyroides viscosum]